MYILLFHTQMAFAGGERLGKMFGDERRGEAWPRGEMAAFDGSEKSGWFRAVGAGMEKRG